MKIAPQRDPVTGGIADPETPKAEQNIGRGTGYGHTGEDPPHVEIVPDHRAELKGREYTIEVTVSVDGNVVSAADSVTTGQGIEGAGLEAAHAACGPASKAWKTEMRKAK